MKVMRDGELNEYGLIKEIENRNTADGLFEVKTSLECDDARHLTLQY
jgi:hypothetical protein